MKYQVGDVFAKSDRIVYIEKFERSIDDEQGYWVVWLFPDGDTDRYCTGLFGITHLLGIGFTHYPVKQ